MRPGLLALLALGCADGGGAPNEYSTSLVYYYSIEDGDSWTYRDSLDAEEEPEASELIHARYLGDGLVEMRRGARWSDAEYEASLTWDTSDGLSLVAWELGANVGEGSYPLFEPNTESGDVVETTGWSCEILAREPAETFYGVFSDTVGARCVGVGLSGTYIFGRDMGLVRFEGGGLVLDLVAPW
ncbi:MAG: hypothetical protein H6741_29695 [Alphaproteobacteria bacterium]|nr:hypothetical protein [Alphaproteobacteria bacterium]MCB9796896.1 hypothetical protein [Alphaproteobacteria bacterium]